MGKAPEVCLYCHGTGEGPGVPCGFCENGKPLDTQADWDNSWGKTFEKIRSRNHSNWHNEYFREMGWLDAKECKASISGNCLAVTRNEPFCHPDCENDTMDGTESGDGGVQFVGVS